MITRDNASSISGTAQNARQRLGEVIQHYREERSTSRREVAQRCKVSIGLVEQWEEGKALPSSDEWKALTRGVHRGLTRFDDLYNRARAEAVNEALKRGEGTQTNPAKVTTSLGDKLVAAAAPAPTLTVVPEPEPEPEPVKTTRAYNRRLPPLPPGAMSAKAVTRRAEFVRNVIRQRPRAPAQGADGIIELVRSTFGVGVSPATVEALRAEVLAIGAGACSAERPTGAAPSTPPPEVVKVVQQQVAEVVQHASASRDVETEISSAVQLLMDAIPNLQTFTISVDEHGEASVDYQIRKVVVTTTGGSLKVKR